MTSACWSTSLTDRPAALLAGRVGRPHGLDGSFYVSEPRPKLLALGAKVRIGPDEVEIVRRAGTDQRPIVRVTGCGDRDGANRLRGEGLLVAATTAPALGEGEWWAEELEGCTVVDGLRPVGIVKRLVGLPSCEVLEVVREDPPAVLLVPLVRDAVRLVDVVARRIDIDLAFLGEA
jgi:16S rRNA processing protein RimM